MKAKRSLALFLLSCLALCMFFALGVSAAEPAPAKGISTHALVSLIIGGVAIVVVIVVCIVKRAKLGESMRAYKREMKNITWYPWKMVWRSTVFVLVAVLATALVIGLLDIAFFEGQYLLTGKGVHFFGGK